LESPQHPDRVFFLENLEKLRGRLGILGNEIRTAVLDAVQQRHDTRAALERYMRMAGSNGAVRDRLAVIAAELETIVPPDFLSRFSQSRVKLLPRYLKALKIRAERAYVYPEKDKAKESQLKARLAEFEEVANRVRLRPTREGLDFIEDVTRMIGEFKISLFAPEIKTLFPVSDKRIEKKLREFPE